MSRELSALYDDLRDIIAPFEWLPLCQRIGEAIDTGRLSEVGAAVTAAIQSTELRAPLLRSYLREWGKMANEYNRRRKVELGRAA
jgi:hypothetical protein